MSAVSVIERLAATSSRTEKEQIIFAAFMEGERDFFIGAKLAYDPLITFGVQKVPLIAEDDGVAGTATFADFLALAEKLRRRELTGNAARDAIYDLASKSDFATWNTFFRRILLKDLKAGVEDKTINKVLQKVSGAHPEALNLMVPIFGCQLAHDGAKEEHSKKISGIKMLDIKLDGVRLLTVLDKEAGSVTQYTRNGKQNDNFTEITTALRAFMDQLPGSVVLDGEVVSTNFQDLMTQVNRRDGVDTSKARLALFDVIPLADFKRGVCKQKQSARHDVLTGLAPLLQATTRDLVYVIPKVIVNLNDSEGQAHFARFNREAIEAGYEGIMVKDPDSFYETRRSTAWLKIKPFIEVSLEVVDIEEGKADGKYKGTTGALVCRGVDDGRMIETNVGSGLSDAMRDTIWANRANYIGMIAEVRADGFTLESGGTVYSMRFPRFKGWRGTKPGEKL